MLDDLAGAKRYVTRWRYGALRCGHLARRGLCRSGREIPRWAIAHSPGTSAGSGLRFSGFLQLLAQPLYFPCGIVDGRNDWKGERCHHAEPASQISQALNDIVWH